MSSVILRFFQNFTKGMIAMGIQSRVNELCDKNRITKMQLEEVLGFGKGYCSKLDGHKPNTKNIQKIADYFGVKVDYILTGEEDAPTPGLSEEYLDLISAYDKLSKENKTAIMQIIKSLSAK